MPDGPSPGGLLAAPGCRSAASGAAARRSVLDGSLCRVWRAAWERPARVGASRDTAGTSDAGSGARSAKRGASACGLAAAAFAGRLASSGDRKLEGLAEAGMIRCNDEDIPGGARDGPARNPSVLKHLVAFRV